jgi:hypothetical protein
MHAFLSMVGAFTVSACALVLGIQETTVGDDAGATNDGDVGDGNGSGDAQPSDAGEDRDAVALPLPPCPATSDATTLVVDAMKGDDAVAPMNGAAYRSITKALAAANAMGASTPITVCVRGAASGAEAVYSEATTGEVFPLELRAPNLTLRGEGEAVVTIFFAGADASEASVGPIVIDVKPAATEAKVQGVRVKTSHGIGLFTEGPGLTLSDSSFATAPGGGVSELIATAALASITRTQVTAVHGSYSCLAVRPLARAVITDSVFDNCYGGVTLAPNSFATITRSTFTRNQWGGVWAAGATSFDTKDCTFTSNVVGLLVETSTMSTSITGTSTGDSFKGNEQAGLRIEMASAPAQASMSISGAHFRLEQKHGLDIAAPIKVVLRGTSFEDGKLAALNIRFPTVTTMLDIGGAGANNVFQSKAHPNKVGICLEAAGDLGAAGNGFAQCPPLSTADCSSGDVSSKGGGAIVTSGCFVVP